MRITTMHAQYRKMLLDSSKLLLGARTCLRGAARRNLSLVSDVPTSPSASGEKTLMQTSFQEY